MSLPSAAEVDSALIALGRGRIPPAELPADVRRAGLIGRAKDAGASWAQVGEALGGIDGKVAKRYAIRLRAAVNRDLKLKGAARLDMEG